jgi:uncharacterized protein (DUF1697 family)
MPRLRDVLAAETDLTGVSTYIASGNIVCDEPADAAAACATVRTVITAEFGVDTPVIHRSHGRLVESESAQPFADGAEKFVHAMFLEDAPSSGAVEALEQRLLPTERIALVGHDLWIDYGDGGVASTKLTTAVLDKALGIAGTARNLRTVRTLIGLTA